jgi:hypothetical protein
VTTFSFPAARALSGGRNAVPANRMITTKLRKDIFALPCISIFIVAPDSFFLFDVVYKPLRFVADSIPPLSNLPTFKPSNNLAAP